jgi:hypothetical protein
MVRLRKEKKRKKEEKKGNEKGKRKRGNGIKRKYIIYF